MPPTRSAQSGGQAPTETRPAEARQHDAGPAKPAAAARNAGPSLPRREPGASMPPVAVTYTPLDEAVLTRIRTALNGLR